MWRRGVKMKRYSAPVMIVVGMVKYALIM